MAIGTVTLDFGAFPGKSDASVDVIGQTGLISSTLIEAWLIPVATADHTADEHMVETIRIVAKFKTNGEFTVYGFNMSQLNEPLEPVSKFQKSASTQPIAFDPQVPRRGGKGTLIWGQWSVAWAWSN